MIINIKTNNDINIYPETDVSTIYQNKLFYARDTIIKNTCIGIDLGTTNYSVGVYINNKFEIIQNEYGNSKTPSCVSFLNNETLIGDSAKSVMYTNITNTIYNIKRVIGKPYNDSILQYPYKIVNKDNIPVINYEDKQFTPEEITAIFLRESKNRASTYLGYNVTSAVITVPSYFNNAQRIATMNAGTIAGLDVKRIIHEQSAAALTYGVNKINQNTEDYLIFHVGGGTFNISFVTMGKGIIRVNATSGDTLLGGEDFDNILVDWCTDKIMKDYHTDIHSIPLSMRKLKDSCEKAKIELSTQMETIIKCKSLYEDTDFSVTLTRDKFNGLCIHLFESIISSMNSILPPDIKNIKDVVLVGGSTNIPKIRNMLFSIVPHLLKNTQINSDNMVVNGAAIQGYYLMKQSRSIQLVETLNDTTIGI